MRKNDSNRNIVKDNFSYTIVMLLFQMIVIFVLPFLREISAESKLHFISVTTCGLFGVTVIRLVAIWKEKRKLWITACGQNRKLRFCLFSFKTQSPIFLCFIQLVVHGSETQMRHKWDKCETKEIKCPKIIDI